MVSDAEFFAWLDGELDRKQAARVEAEVAANPDLSQLAANHRAMQARLKAAFEPLLDAPPPEPILAALHHRAGAEIISFARVQEEHQRRNWRPIVQWGSVAATLVIGIVLGTALPQKHGAAPVELESGRIYAAAALDHALDTQLASAPGGDLRIGLTFRDRSGAICRSFTSSNSSGLACRDNGRWQLRGLFGTPQGQSTDYRMAGGMDSALGALVDETMAGEPFNSAQERDAKQRRWK